MTKRKAQSAPKKRQAAPPIVTIAPPAVPAPAPQATPPAEPKPSPPTQKIGHKIFLGAWAYVIGLLVALAAAIINPQGLGYYTILILGALGIVVGLMNITDEEVLLFLVASLAFIVSTSSVSAVLPDGFGFLRTLLHGVIVFTGTGAFVVAFKALFKVAKSE